MPDVTRALPVDSPSRASLIQASRQQRLAVSLGSSFLGFATHLGFLQELHRQGIRPTAISGSSAGAMVAGLFAAGIPFESMEDAFRQERLRRAFDEWQTPFRLWGTLLGIPRYTGIFLGKKLEPLLREKLGDLRIEACTRARLSIAVTDLSNHRIEIRQQGPLVETILASCAVPGVLAPRKIADRLYWDGGMGCPDPLDPFIVEDEITHIVSHSIIFGSRQDKGAEQSGMSLLTALLAGNQVSCDEMLRWKIEAARARGKTVIAAETKTPCPRLGLPLTIPSKSPWPEQVHQLMGLGAHTAKATLRNASHGPESPRTDLERTSHGEPVKDD